ncbi:MAG: FeoB small GTPase domain-containing protein [Candidatus Saccharibacteria bacterium]|nr:FeoB small GTPase domain-containing protein [Candidatus Saccharibacteria bacterium]
MGDVKIVFIGKTNSGKTTFTKLLTDAEAHASFFDNLNVDIGRFAITMTEYDLPFDYYAPGKTVVFRGKSLEERSTEKILEDVSLMLQAGVVHLNTTARDLGLYRTELVFNERVIYVCDTGDKELDQKLKELLEQYYCKYAEVPYAVFAYDDVVDRTAEPIRTVPHAKKMVDAKYKIYYDCIAKGIERAGYLMLTKNELFGSLLLAAVDLMVAEPPKT